MAEGYGMIAERSDLGDSREAETEPRSGAALACAILGLSAMGLFVVKAFQYHHGPFAWFTGIGILGFGLCVVPLVHERAGVGAKVLGVIGVIGGVLIGFLVLCWIVAMGRALGTPMR